MNKIRSFKPKANKSKVKQVTEGEVQISVGDHFDSSQPIVRLVPLGGVGDVTKNMYVYEYGQDIVVIDCGVGFPEADMLGVDLVIPDISYLKDKVDRIKAIIITHAHDDHIGGLPYLWPQLNCPVYSQRLTIGLIKAKFIEHKLPTEQLFELNIDSTVELGAFKLSFYQVSHSIPDSTGIVLEVGDYRMIHQADFKMDWTPVNGQRTDVGRVASLGDQGVDFMTIDCLRVEKPGVNLSEKTIEATFAGIEEQTLGKVLVTMTSSNFTRVQQVINVCIKSGRKLALAGRSMEGNFQVARDLGYLDVPANLVIAPDAISKFPPDKLMILIAGSQGQPGSALSRVANGEHKFITLGQNDSVVFSADPIPSTESTQSAMIDRLTILGCNVFYSAITSQLHVSGHAAADEVRTMIALAKPRAMMGIGGTYRHMKVFNRMMVDMGYHSDQALMAVDGDVIEISKSGAKIRGRVKVSNIYVDGLGVGDIGQVVLRDRQVMSEEGIVMVIVPVDTQDGGLAGDVDLVTRGFVFEKGAEELLNQAKDLVIKALNENSKNIHDWRFIRRHIEDELEHFLYTQTQRRPMILPVVVEV